MLLFWSFDLAAALHCRTKKFCWAPMAGMWVALFVNGGLHGRSHVGCLEFNRNFRQGPGVNVTVWRLSTRHKPNGRQCISFTAFAVRPAMAAIGGIGGETLASNDLLTLSGLTRVPQCWLRS